MVKEESENRKKRERKEKSKSISESKENKKNEELKSEGEKIDENLTPKEKRIEKRITKDLIKIFAFFGLLVIIFLVSQQIFEKRSHVEYQGLQFSREKMGELDVYHYSYYFENKAGGVTKYNLYLRNNPSENLVPVIGGKITYPPERTVYVSLNTEGLEECKYSVLAIGDLARFLTENELKVKSGNLNKEEAEMKNETYVSCENKVNNPVIEILQGEETKIENQGLCYRITVANCEILEATEKFKVQSILDAREE